MTSVIARRVKVALLCEDVRLELGNKMTIVGVFGGDVVVPSLPATLSVSAYVQYLPEILGTQELEFTLNYEGKGLVKINASIEVIEPDTIAALWLPRINTTLASGPGELTLDLALLPEPPETIIRKRLLIADTAPTTSTVFPPPS